MKKKLTLFLIVFWAMLLASTANAAVPMAQSIKKVSNARAGVFITWPKSSNASGYKIYRRVNNGAWTLLKTISNRNTVSYTDTTAVNGRFYSYTVRGYIGSVQSSYNQKGLSIFRLRSPYSISKCVSSTAGQVTLSWDKNGSATGYQVVYSTNSSFSNAVRVKVKGNRAGGTTIKNLVKGKTYYFRLQTYKTVNGKNYFSGLCGKKSVKVKTAETSWEQREKAAGRLILSGTIRSYTYDETVKLQGYPDYNAAWTNRNGRYRIIVLDSPQSIRINSVDGYFTGTTSLILVGSPYTTGANIPASYNGKHIVFSISPANTYWPSDTSIPLGSARTTDVHVKGYS